VVQRCSAAPLKRLRRIPLMPWHAYRYLWKPFRGSQGAPKS
jgi:hypothetical protein